MKYKRKIEIPIQPGCQPHSLPYPYLDATTIDDAINGKQIGILGLLDEGDKVDED